MPRIKSTFFRSNNGQLAKFFVDNFDLKQDGRYLIQKRESNKGTAIEIETNPASVRHKNNNIYWKVGVCMPDVAKQVELLKSKGVNVSKPSQFRDIGFLCHLQDSDGNGMELLQHTFEKNFKGPHPNNPITIGQITIRTKSAKESLAFYRDKLGMRLLSIQPVTPMGFTLYFFGYTDENPPDSNPEGVANREWLWSRPFCTIEVVANDNPTEQPYCDLQPEEKGWLGIRISCTKDEAKNKFGITTNTLLRDPNNIPVHVDIE